MTEYLLDKITENEYSMLNAYREWYGWTEAECDNNEPSQPIRTILTEWERSNQNLFTLLGNSLTISKEVEFSRSQDEIHRDMFKMVEEHQKLGRCDREGWKFVREFYGWYSNHFPLHSHFYWSERALTPEELEENDRNVPIRDGLSELISISTLTANVFEGDEFSIPLPDGKSLKVRKGSKVIKTLGKLAEIFNIPYFEDFRICHSLVHNQKTVKGTLTLSIHPMDYWTMSDNNCGWESCMNWRDYGGYRHGTIEMMNSPYVVVAYLASEQNMGICRDYEWNSKKWRQLFIVNKDVILGVKPYPCKNEEITDTVMMWLKSLAKENMGWEYTSETPLKWTSTALFSNPADADDVQFRISFYSNHMYTDVGCMDFHPIFLGTDLYGEDIPKNNYATYPLLEINYSGAAQCINCGQIDPELGDESFLCCTTCESVVRCSECGDRINPHTAFYVGDYCLCDYCYNEHTTECEICGDVDFNDNFVDIRILPKLDDSKQEWAEGIRKKYYATDYRPKDPDYRIGFTGFNESMCFNCYANFVNRYLKPDCKLHRYTTGYGSHYFCYFEDLNEEGLEKLNCSYIAEDMKNGLTQEELIEKYWIMEVEWIRVIE